MSWAWDKIDKMTWEFLRLDGGPGRPRPTLSVLGAGLAFAEEAF